MRQLAGGVDWGALRSSTAAVGGCGAEGTAHGSVRQQRCSGGLGKGHTKH